MLEVRPDFIVIGARTLIDDRHGVQLIATNDVASTRLDVDLEMDDRFDFYDITRPPRSTLTADLRAKLRSFAITYGPDYRTAWEHLMRMGNPDDPQARKWANQAIEPPRLQLPPGA